MKAAAVLRVATYNIHKGVRGIGPAKRLEIHGLSQAIQTLDADLILLQEVHLFHHKHAQTFQHQQPAWPAQGQAEFLAPKGYDSIYRSNAITPHGEHGNALLCRWPLADASHKDVSHHRFEQRGLLHATLDWQGTRIHILVAHLGLIHASRLYQVQHIQRFMAEHIPPDAPVILGGDFNDWAERLDRPLQAMGLTRAEPDSKANHRRWRTFPARVPMFALDRIYTRGLNCVGGEVPRGLSWGRLSDHLPLVVELALR